MSVFVILVLLGCVAVDGDILFRRIPLSATLASSALHLLRCSDPLPPVSQMRKRAIVRDNNRTILFGFAQDGQAVLSVFEGSSQTQCLEFSSMRPHALLWDNVIQRDSLFIVLLSRQAPVQKELVAALRGGWCSNVWDTLMRPPILHNWVLIVARVCAITGSITGATYIAAVNETGSLAAITVQRGNFGIEITSGPLFSIHVSGRLVLPDSLPPLHCIGPSPFVHTLLFSSNLSTLDQMSADVACGGTGVVVAVRGLPPKFRGPPIIATVAISLFLLFVLVVSCFIVSF
jgi:hypothetical protein